MSKALAVAKINFKTSRLAYMIFLICMGAVLISTPLNALIPADAAEGSYEISPGSFGYLLVILFCVFVPALHFRKFINLNVKKSDYLKGCAVSYVGISLVASALNTLCYFTVDAFLMNLGSMSAMGILNLLDVFGWSANGMLVATIQQFAFLLLLAAAAHLVTSIQTYAYGWIVDVIIAAILAVFIPIPPLRDILLGFFWLVIFTPNALLQIASCLVIAAVLFLLSIWPVKNKPV